MQIENLEERLNRIAAALDSISAGQHSADRELPVGEDGLGIVERDINYLMMDLQTMELANREKEASLVLQQQDLAEKLRVIKAQSDVLESQKRELESKLDTIRRQAEAIRELSTPVLEIEDSIIALPIVGALDSARALDMTTKLLAYIERHGVKCVILDLTGVDIVDTKTADHLIKVAQATALMGARCTMTGLSPSVAQTLTAIGVDMRGLRTLRNLKDGLRDSLALLKRTHSHREEG